MIYPKNVSLVDIIIGLPGIFNVNSNMDYKNIDDPIKIFFNVSENNNKGLFLLTRCVDRRYWKYGYLWRIELVVGDSYINNELPIHYILNSSAVTGNDAIEQSNDLIENIQWHFTNPNFLKCYDIDKNYFEKEYKKNHRKFKLKNINYL